MKPYQQVVLGLAFLAQIDCTLAASSLSVLRSFGNVDNAAAYPTAEVIEGSDGTLYGTTIGGGSAGKGTIYRLDKDGSGFGVLLNCGTATNLAARPTAALLEGSDGLLYGTSSEGGQFGYGTVFRLAKDGSGFMLLKSFGGDDGAYPEAQLLEASDGRLYGTTSGGGTNDYGVVFRIGKDGTGFLALTNFASINGASPEGRLIEASDGALYGTTFGGGSNDVGTVFRLNKDGSGLTVLKRFFALQPGGFGPVGTLVEGTNGVLFGITTAGGTNASGAIYRLNLDGSDFALVRDFVAESGRVPPAELILGSDGWLYGTTSDGGSNNFGVVFRIGQDGAGFTVLTHLLRPKGPAAALLEASDGALYGVTQFGGDSDVGTVFKVQKDGTALAVLTGLSASGGDGAASAAKLEVGGDGTLYGTTRLGGERGAGTVFSIRFDGRAYRQISSLDTSAGISGPLADVSVGSDGAFYGSSPYGGSSGLGGMFRLQPDGSGLTLLYSLSDATNGQEPRASLVQAGTGAMYGTATMGGASGQGVLFRLNPDGSSYTVLKQFVSYFTAGNSGPGANPVQALLEGSDQMLYGTAYWGSVSNNGAVFRLGLDGNGYTILHSFGNALTNGANPMSPLLAASDGAFYGTAYAGGSTNNAGVVYRLNPDGSGFQVLRTFAGTGNDARHPCGNLAEGPDGALYGCTERGGTADRGTLFMLNKDGGGYATLASFGGPLGSYPRGGVVVGPDGAIYGTTEQGGDLDAGTVFRYGLPIEEITALGLQQGAVSVTGLGLAGATYFLERSTQIGPSPPWTTICSTNAGADGRFVLLDGDPPAIGAFYRLRR